MEERFRECFRIYDLVEAVQALTFKMPYLLERMLRFLRVVPDSYPDFLCDRCCGDVKDESLLCTRLDNYRQVQLSWLFRLLLSYWPFTVPRWSLDFSEFKTSHISDTLVKKLENAKNWKLCFVTCMLNIHFLHKQPERLINFKHHMWSPVSL